MSEKSSIDLDGHSQPLKGGYDPACPACKNLVSVLSDDLCVYLTLRVTGRFKSVMQQLDELARLMTKAEPLIEGVLREIDQPPGEDLKTSFNAFRNAVEFVRSNYPNPKGDRVKIPLEFLMANYFAEYHIRPTPSFKLTGYSDIPTPNNSATRFIREVWDLAQSKLQKHREMDRDYYYFTGYYQKQEAVLQADFRHTMNEILRDWGDTPPNPASISPLVGQVSLWSGGDEW